MRNMCKLAVHDLNFASPAMDFRFFDGSLELCSLRQSPAARSWIFLVTTMARKRPSAKRIRLVAQPDREPELGNPYNSELERTKVALAAANSCLTRRRQCERGLTGPAASAQASPNGRVGVWGPRQWSSALRCATLRDRSSGMHRDDGFGSWSRRQRCCRGLA
jgi:hypothetical protein